MCVSVFGFSTEWIVTVRNAFITGICNGDLRSCLFMALAVLYKSKTVLKKWHLSGSRLYGEIG